MSTWAAPGDAAERAAAVIVPDAQITERAKGFPASLLGTRLSDIGARRMTLADMETPIMSVDLDRIHRNEERFSGWARERGILLAPHGKTTMSPALWASLLQAGAVAITVATGWQARYAFAHGVTRVMLANNLVDRAAIRALAALLAPTSASAPTRELVVWADSLEAVQILDGALRDSPAPPLDVLVDVGAVGGRTGARTIASAVRVAEAVAATPRLRLRGLAGYEGSFGADRSDASSRAVTHYLDTLARCTKEFLDVGLLRADGSAIVSVGGSSFPDLVADRLGHLSADTTLVVRAGAFQVHDSGFYDRVSPMRTEVDTTPLVAAAHVWARVISAPERGLAVLDAGRRDLPVDIDMPTVERVLGRDGLLPASVRVLAVNDQHALVRGDGVAALRVGDVVRLGLSHPCTAFDKWPVVAAIDDADSATPRVIGAIATAF